MKKIFLSLFLLASSISMIVSCTNEKLDPVASSTSINLTSPTGGTYVLSGGTAATNAFTASWSPAKFGFSGAITYYLQAVKGSASFDSAQAIVLSTYNSDVELNEKAVNQRDLNNLLLSTGGSIGSSDTYRLRVIGKPSTQLASSTNGVIAVSNEITITATPYDTFDEFDRIYVPGNYQANSGYGSNWTPGDAKIARLFSAGNDGKYEGFVWMNDATPAFKFTPVPAWSGDKGESNGSGAYSGVLGTASDIKPADGAGAYFFTVNWPSLTYTMTKQQVAIIGQATPNGWGTPTYLNFETNPSSPYYQMFTIDLPLTNDEFLIRLKDDWSSKMGTLSGTSETTSSGSQYKIKLNGGNMKVPASGNYKIVLDVRNSANYNIRLMPQ